MPVMRGSWRCCVARTDDRISLGAPRSMTLVTVAVHALAAGLLFTVQPGWVGWAGLPVVLAGAGWELRRIAGMPRGLRCPVDLGPEAPWLLDDGWCGELLDAPCASRWLMVIRLLRPADRSVRWLVWGGEQLRDADARRLLRLLRRHPH